MKYFSELMEELSGNGVNAEDKKGDKKSCVGFR